MIGRRLGVLAVLLAGGTIIAAQQPQQSPDQLVRFKAVTSGVSVDVVVLRGRSPVTGLKSHDFILTDNGVRQRIESVSSAALPIDVTLAVDTSSSVIANIDEFKTEVRRFAGMLRQNDRIRVVAFGTGVVEAVRMRPAGEKLNLDALDARGATSLNDALLYSLLWPPGQQRRHLIIVLTDGIDTVSTMSGPDVVAAAARVETVVAALRVRPAAQTPAAAGPPRHEPQAPQGGPPGGYVLRYMPDGVSADGVHDVSVTLNKPDANKYVIRARKSYFGG